jgi:hypothetical protein
MRARVVAAPLLEGPPLAGVQRGGGGDYCGFMFRLARHHPHTHSILCVARVSRLIVCAQARRNEAFRPTRDCAARVHVELGLFVLYRDNISGASCNTAHSGALAWQDHQTAGACPCLPACLPAFACLPASLPCLASLSCVHSFTHSDPCFSAHSAYLLSSTFADGRVVARAAAMSSVVISPSWILK